MTGKIAAVSMVRNECDIIELFLKINLRHLDFILVIDHNSDDGTTEILEYFCKNTNKVSRAIFKDPAYSQAFITTKYVNELARTNDFQYIMVLDADEFIQVDQPGQSLHDAISDRLSPTQIGLMPWRTYCPISSDYYQQDAPLYTNFRMRENEPEQYYKIILGNEFAKDCKVSMGNHLAHNRRYRDSPIPLPITVQHVPVRSPDQIIRKAILGSHAMNMRRDRKPGEGFHWDTIANFIRDRQYKIDENDFQILSQTYAADTNESDTVNLLDDCPRVGNIDDIITMKNISKIDLMSAFDKYISICVNQINNTDIKYKNMYLNKFDKLKIFNKFFKYIFRSGFVA